ncbi:hypothetical protein ColTof3_13867 [Colletotrichum tofieldiae]|nr:hypothetical protein ColTof3_13867 [Colletotrichum tofieldiae]
MTTSSSRFSDGELSARIWRDVKKSVFGDQEREFLPERYLDSIITRQYVIDAFDLSQEEDFNNELVVYTFSEAKKIFATTVHVLDWLAGSGLRDVMKDFMACGITDKRLPIKLTDFAVATPLKSGRNIIWTPKRCKDFDQHQWTYLAQVFCTKDIHYTLDQRCILPFTARVGDDDAGSYGQVSGYKICREHLDDVENPTPIGPTYVAVKTMRPTMKQDRKETALIWEREADAMWKMNKLGQKHILRCLATFRRIHNNEEDHYLMLEWANGGNLRKLWNTFNRKSLTPELVQAVAVQLRGLAEAIFTAHQGDPVTKATFRHGDIKPENILWFKDDSGGIGTLKIGDWGTAKQHNIVTRLRTNPTSSGSGTRRYEPPEEVIGLVNGLSPSSHSNTPKKLRSRLYDIWPMGCITLEFLIWLMYGPQGLRRFNHCVSSDELGSSAPFYQIIKKESGGNKAVVHKSVVKWMDHMAKDPVCAPGSTALGDLLELVRDSLLVVDVPSNMGSEISENGDPKQDDFSGETTLVEPVRNTNLESTTEQVPTTAPRISIIAPETSSSQLAPECVPLKKSGSPYKATRALARQFRDQMKVITGQPNAPPDLDAEESRRDLCQPAEHFTAESSFGLEGLSVSATERFDDSWDLIEDNQFTQRVFSSNELAALRDEYTAPSSNLCEQCADFRTQLWRPGFDISYTLEHLREHHQCDLCKLFWKVCQRQGLTKRTNVIFRREGSSLKVNDSRQPALSIFKGLGK